MTRRVVCPNCNGKGYVVLTAPWQRDQDPPDCGECAGYGYVIQGEPLGPDARDNNIDVVREIQQC